MSDTKKELITAHVKMDEKIFKRFSHWDTFHLRKRWRRPALFCAIMAAFAIVCFVLRKEESVLIGSVLLIIALGLPLIWVGFYFSSVRLQAVQLKLEKPRPVYTIALGDDIRIHNDLKPEPDVTVRWEQVFGIWRDKKATYLYVTAAKGFILPDGQYDTDLDALWYLFASHLPKERLHGVAFRKEERKA